MIAVYSTAEFGSSLALYDTDDDMDDGLVAESWTDLTGGLPSGFATTAVTAFLRERDWVVHGNWTYDQEHDEHRAAVYARV